MPSPDADRRSPDDRRRNLTVAVVLLIAIVGGALLTAALVGDPPREEPAADRGALPEDLEMIPQPGAGTAPEDAGDRGGGQQVLVLVLMVAAVATLAGLAWRSSVRARRRANRTAAPPTSRDGVPRP